MNDEKEKEKTILGISKLPETETPLPELGNGCEPPEFQFPKPVRVAIKIDTDQAINQIIEFRTRSIMKFFDQFLEFCNESGLDIFILESIEPVEQEKVREMFLDYLRKTIRAEFSCPKRYDFNDNRCGWIEGDRYPFPVRETPFIPRFNAKDNDFMFGSSRIEESLPITQTDDVPSFTKQFVEGKFDVELTDEGKKLIEGIKIVKDGSENENK